MKLTLHHINLCTTNVRRWTVSIRMCWAGSRDRRPASPVKEERHMQVMCLCQTAPFGSPCHPRYSSRISHRADREPSGAGHIAYRCDDLEAFKAHLDASGVPYSDWGERAVNGWKQFFTTLMAMSLRYIRLTKTEFAHPIGHLRLVENISDRLLLFTGLPQPALRAGLGWR